jgi:PPOX class probable F420-dependent enzyme
VLLAALSRIVMPNPARSAPGSAAGDDVFTAAIPQRALGGDMTILNQEEPAHAAAAARLRTEPIIWLTTVARSGQPQSTPVWFLWEAGEFLIYGLANGPKTRNIGSNPHVCLHLEGDGRGGANVIFEGTARIDPAGPRADAVPAYIEKYRQFIDSYGWTPESFAKDYPYVIRVSPTRARIW